MPAQFALEGDIGLFRVSGVLSGAELKRAQGECEDEIRRYGMIKLLVVLSNFQGWEKGTGWDDWSFAERNDEHIVKMAIVGEEKWRDQIFVFTAKDLRPMPIEFFISPSPLGRWIRPMSV